MFGSQGEAINFLPKLNQAFEIGDLRIRWVTIATIGVGALLLTAMALFLSRTDLGLSIVPRPSTSRPRGFSACARSE